LWAVWHLTDHFTEGRLGIDALISGVPIILAREGAEVILLITRL